jgi:hypothetical protein
MIWVIIWTMLHFFSLFLISSSLTSAGLSHPSPDLSQANAPQPDVQLITRIIALAELGAAPKYQLTDLAVLEDAITNQRSGIQVLVTGKVIRVLSDDTEGGRHQRFIVALANAQTLLVAHNIDLAPRVDNLQVGDQLYIYGEYAWNSQGGVIHWTHHDPDGSHVGGWIEKNGVIYH